MKTFKMLKSNLPKIIVIALFLLGFAAEALATTYYVSPSGSDSSSGSSSAPFKSIQKAAGMVNPGDTVIVRDGTYTDTERDDIVVRLSRGGTSSNWITFKAENKWGAVLDGQDTADYCWVNLAGANYIRIEDFEIKRAGVTGIHSNDSNHDILISGNLIHDIARHTIADSGGRNGIYMGNNSYNFTIDSNIFHTNGRLNPYTTPSATQASCTDSSGNNNCYNHDHGIYARGHDNTIVNNIFYNHKSGWPIQLTGSTGASDGPRWYIINNTFADANTQRDGHVDVWTASSGHMVTYLYLQNNISYNPYQNFLAGSAPGSSTWYLKNNLVYPGALGSGQKYTASNNITGQNPQFVNAANKDFHLQSASPAINKGTDIAGYDYDADEKPIVGAPDIGAYEYSGSTTSLSTLSTDTTAPSTPTGLAATAASTSQINLTWTASTDNKGVTGYKVYRGSALIATTANRSYSDTGLSAATTYTYKVSAYDAAGNVSAQSALASAKTLSATAASDTQAPAVPANLKATAASASQINLSWTASSDNVKVTGYRVYRNGTQIATVTTTSYSNAGLAASTAYIYKVSAYDAAGNVSSQSASASATTPSATTIPPSTSKYTISGTITDTSGDAVVGATVILKKNGVTQKGIPSGTDGVYSFTGLDSGTYTLTAAKSGYDCQSTAGTQPVSAVVSTTVGPDQVVDFSLAKSPLTLP